MEYDNLFKDAVNYLLAPRKGDWVGGGFSPFWTTMTMYKMATVVKN